MLNNDGVKKATYGAPRQILANVEFQYSVGCRVPKTMGVSANGRTLVKAGTPVFIDLGVRDTLPVAEPGAVEETATGSVVTGAAITKVEVVAATFKTAVSNTAGTYKFKATVAEGTTTWKLGNDTVTLNTYGITVTGTVANNDEIQVIFTASGTVTANAVLLHDVDVTDAAVGGTKNGTALLWGFVNINRLDSDVQALVTAGTKIGDVQFLNA